MSQPQQLEDWLTWIQQTHAQPIAFGLERVRCVAVRMAIHRIAQQVIVVGGTNGKGSTVAMISAMARAGGWRVGQYMSPHISRFNERIWLNGQAVSDADLVTAFGQVERARQNTPLTYFEYATLAAFWLFQQADLDLAVVEVGMGGRLDAVNLIDSDVAVITTVAIDHTEWLGPDREAIGREKAGILRAQKPAILGEEAPPASVLRHAYQIGALSIRLGCDFFCDRLPSGDWSWRDAAVSIGLPAPRLPGPIQWTNAAVAVAALRALPRALPTSALAQGLLACTLPGRFQLASYRGQPVVLDVCHNPQAVSQFAAGLAAKPCNGQTHAIFAALADKAIGQMSLAIRAEIHQWHVAGLACPRGQSADALAKALAECGITCASQSATVSEALARAHSACAPTDRLCVFGSFYTVAEALAQCD